MPSIENRVSLRPYNTFGINVTCKYLTQIHSESDFQSLLKEPVYRDNKRLILGGGSNVLFRDDFDGLVILNRMKGISVLREENDKVYVRAAAGEVWHEFVQWCIRHGFGGLENLSLIPGCVGASPMQNIGAYGVEIREVFDSLEALNTTTGARRIFTLEECHFGYRESVFKHQFRDQYLITSVTFILKKNASVNTSYGAINDELKKMGIEKPGIADVSSAVINIRRSKLPDPAVTGNAGSFFKNPEVPEQVYARLKNEFPDIVAYKTNNGYKLAAGWMIEQCGLKGTTVGGASVHTRQALVLINTGSATGQDVYDLSTLVIESVQKKFGVTLEREVNIIG